MKKIIFLLLFLFCLAGFIYLVKYIQFDEPEEIDQETAKEQTSFGIWCQKDNERIGPCFHFDQTGILFKKTPAVSGGFILNLYSGQPAKAGSRIASPEMIDFIRQITADDAWPISNFTIISSEDLRGTTAAGWQVYFNPNYSAESQLTALKAVLKEEINQPADLEYIDLRIENRVYYK